MINSIAVPGSVELINITPYNPLISKCQIKVCWVGDEPNRNKSIITKDVAAEIANSLPGSPIVGYYNETNDDFEQHNKIIELSNGKFRLKPTTQPYGFVDLNAKVWFEKFADEGIEREYLVTEGWLWTGQFPECQRIIEKGNNQSMELSELNLDASWTKDANGNNQFFIINEAIISKLCILGEEYEPCFEGAQITRVEFSLEDDFKQRLFSMMKEIKDILDKGGAPMFTTYAVEIGDSLWRAIYAHIEKNYPADEYCSIYHIEGVYEEENQKFAILQHNETSEYFRLNFELTENGIAFAAELIAVDKEFTPSAEPQFSLESYNEFVAQYAEEKKAAKEGKEEEKELCPKCGKPLDECECEEEDKKDYVLEEIPEYVELQSNFSALTENYSALETRVKELVSEKEKLENSLNELKAFKAGVEKKEKEAMIASFYMLSDEDKRDVVSNIDTYSLDEIEAKLSIICVRNKVSFADIENTPKQEVTTFHLNSNGGSDNVPAWVKAIQAVANNN